MLGIMETNKELFKAEKKKVCVYIYRERETHTHTHKSDF